MGLFNKKELQRISELEQQNTKLQKIIDDLGASDSIKIKNHITELKNEYEIRQFFSPEGCTITEKDGTETEGGKLLPSAYFELEMKKGESVKITGGGYGHGVGMSQTAANVMAEEGYDYRIILDYFFKNITIENLG